MNRKRKKREKQIEHALSHTHRIDRPYTKIKLRKRFRATKTEKKPETEQNLKRRRSVEDVVCVAVVAVAQPTVHQFRQKKQ